MKLSVTLLGLDLFSIELTTDSDDGEGLGDVTSTGHEPGAIVGFTLPSTDWGESADTSRP